ncbi:hypothetical protein Tco_0704121 [Tanacetum coccineum]|uniref:Uncharacterized protein n=1 Tax=Tanacetum coccineum TaxID=301880 RepID=A0ABQ4Y0S7_9ASTR
MKLTTLSTDARYGAVADQENPPLEQTGVQEKKDRKKNLLLPSAPSETPTKTAEKTTSTGSKTHEKSASQSTP